MEMTARQRLYYKRKNAGLCVDCGGQTDGGRRLCAACEEKRKTYVNETRAFFKNIGLCPRCGRNVIFKGESTCPECKAQNTIGAQKRRDKDRKAYNAQMAEYHKSEYAEKKKQGICPRCGKKKTNGSYVWCKTCRYKTSQKRNERKARTEAPKISRNERYKLGLCYFCDNPVKPGYKCCEKHCQMNAEKGKKGRERQRELGIL